MKIAVIGTGYVGLVSGVCFSEFGSNVVCIDNNVEKIQMLNNGNVPIYEPGLDKLIAKNMKAKRLTFSSSISNIVNADIVFIAVGTPSNQDGSANLDYIYQAAQDLSNYINDDSVLVVKSTVPVGTTRKLKNFLLEISGKNIDVAFNPEFLKEGVAINDFMHPDRVIFGIESEKAKKVLKHIYRPLFAFNTPIVFTNLETAELSKYASNAFLAMKVTFINEIASLCESCNADVMQVALSMGLDKRIGDKFLQAGPGYGGSCFPKDTLALSNFAKKFGVNMNLVDETISTNNRIKQLMITKILNALNNDIENKNISILGITFKANTDDMRDSPSIEIINKLLLLNAKINIYDPSNSEQAKNIFYNKVNWFDDAYENCKNADAVIIITDWSEFRALNLQTLRNVVKNPLLIDLRNVYSIQEIESSGFEYHSVGRPVLKIN